MVGKKQPNANSVQQEPIKCLSILLQTEIDLVGAGRTDAGVHAVQMFAHFDYELSFDTQRIVYKMNSFLPNDISVSKIFEVKKDTHAFRFSAISRTYKYYISEKKNIFNPNLHLVYKNLDIDKMNDSCVYLIGEQDFTSFSKVNTDTFTNNCNITKAVWKKESDTSCVYYHCKSISKKYGSFNSRNFDRCRLWKNKFFRCEKYIRKER